MKWIACAVMLIGSRGYAAPPDSASTGGFSSLTIDSGNDTAYVFLDSVRVGTTPFTADSLAPGLHRLRLVQIDLSSWLTGTINDTVLLAPGDRKTMSYHFIPRINLITEPSGATVSIADSIIGTTPLMISASSGQALPERVTVEKHGYEKMVIPLTTGQEGINFVLLKKIWQSDLPEGPMSNEVTGGRSSLKIFIAGGAALAAGVATAYFKIKADGRNQQFLETGIPSLRDDMRRLDTAAAISLVVTQIGFAFFSYFLLSE